LSSSIAFAGSNEKAASAWTNTLKDRRPDARVGLALSVPIDQIFVRAALESARLEAQRQALAVKSQEAWVRFDVDNGLADLDTNLQLLALADKQVELAELKLSNESDKYKNGVSTLADVVRFQRDLDSALIASQRLTRDIYVGEARLLASQGVLGESVGVGLR
jgi:outer membrane protein TolC